MKIIFKEEDKLNLGLLNKKIILMINKIKEEYNQLVEYKKQIMYYKVIIGENII